jgi:hypothetical protein
MDLLYLFYDNFSLFLGRGRDRGGETAEGGISLINSGVNPIEGKNDCISSLKYVNGGRNEGLNSPRES